jgi:hypothetical protein
LYTGNFNPLMMVSMDGKKGSTDLAKTGGLGRARWAILPEPPEPRNCALRGCCASSSAPIRKACRLCPQSGYTARHAFAAEIY